MGQTDEQYPPSSDDRQPNNKKVAICEFFSCDAYLNREDCFSKVECKDCDYGSLMRRLETILKELYLFPDMYKRYLPKQQYFEYMNMDEMVKYGITIQELVALFFHPPPNDKPMWKWVFSLRDRRQIVARVICSDLEDQGKFIQDKSDGRLYYYLNQDHKILFVTEKRKEFDPDFESFLVLKYGLFDETAILKYCLQYILQNHEDHVVHKLFYFDETTLTLYIYDRNQCYYRLDGENITKYPNGTHLFFREDESTTHHIEYIPSIERQPPEELPPGLLHNTSNLLWNYLFNRTNYHAVTALTEKQQIVQLILNFYTFPFVSYLRNGKPIIAFIGEKGSGKTFTLRLLGIFLVDPSFEVRKMMDNEESFVVGVVNNQFLFLDNVDASYPWLQDYLACVVTGTTIARRKFYKEFIESKVNPDCVIGITARDPQFGRDDVVDRALLSHVRRFDTFISEKKLLQPILEHYDLLWSLYMDDLNQVVSFIRENGISLLQTGHRLADWVELANVINEVLGVADFYDVNFTHLLDAMSEERTAFVFENEAIWPYLNKIAEEEQGRWLSAREIHEKLQVIAPKYKISARGISRKLNNLRSELAKVLGFEIRKNPSNKVYEFYFGRTPPQDRQTTLYHHGIQGVHTPYDLFKLSWQTIISKNGDSKEKGITLMEIKGEFPFLTEKELERDLETCRAENQVFSPKVGYFKPVEEI